MTTKNTTQDSISADFIRDRAAQFNSQTGWDIDAAQALALEVLTDANAHAEVRLYKAAPELLAACQLYVRAKVDGGVSMADLSAKADEAIRAAIARATGDSQAEGGRL
jgi:hypothetical protein